MPRENNVDLIPMQLDVLKSVTRVTKRSCDIQTNQTGKKIHQLRDLAAVDEPKAVRQGKKVNSA